MASDLHRPHVFVNDKSEDRDVAGQVVAGLRNEGLVVWWDQALDAGDRFSEEIDRNVRAALGGPRVAESALEQLG